MHVLSNSLAASVCALIYYFTGNNLFLIAFIASLAEAFADTAASGIGVISGRAYDLFRLRKCVAGESGGMSVLGTLSSLGAASSVALIALGFGCINHAGALIVILSAFLGAVFDSLLGSLLQVKYKCEACGAIVESESHCGKPTLKHRGISFVDNNLVNLFGTLFSVIVAILLAQ